MIKLYLGGEEISSFEVPEGNAQEVGSDAEDDGQQEDVRIPGLGGQIAIGALQGSVQLDFNGARFRLSQRVYQSEITDWHSRHGICVQLTLLVSSISVELVGKQ